MSEISQKAMTNIRENFETGTDSVCTKLEEEKKETKARQTWPRRPPPESAKPESHGEQWRRLKRDRWNQASPPPPAATLPPAPSKRLDFLAQVRLCGDCRDKEYRKQHIEECKECREQAQSVQLLKPRPLSDKEILQAGLTGKFAAAHADEDADEDEDEWDD